MREILEGVIVEDVKGLKRAAAASALALIWENRIVIDAGLREHPLLRRVILRHELGHMRFAQKHGMTRRTGLLNLGWELIWYRATGGIPIYIFWFIEWLKSKRKKAWARSRY